VLDPVDLGLDHGLVAAQAVADTENPPRAPALEGVDVALARGETAKIARSDPVAACDFVQYGVRTKPCDARIHAPPSGLGRGRRGHARS
jgi:hypothetical protein